MSSPAARKPRSGRKDSNASNASSDASEDLADGVEALDIEDDGAEAGPDSSTNAGTPGKKKRRNRKKKKKVVEPTPVEDVASVMQRSAGYELEIGAIKVRGENYLEDGVKIPPPCPPTMEIVHLEIYMCDTQIFHVCSKKDNWLQQYKAAQAAKKGSGAAASSAGGKKGKKGGAASSAAAAAASPSPASSPSSASSSSSSSSALPDLSSGEGLRPFDDDFFFVVNFHVQTAPSYHLTMYFQRREVARANASAAGQETSTEEEHEPEAAAQARQAFDTLFARFIQGDTAFRNSRLKLLPFLVDGGNWFVSKAVGNRPAIIGTKIGTTYHCNAAQNYMEVDIDVSGSRLGSGIFRVVKGYAAYLTLDLTLLIEGQEDDELPEVILGGCRLRRVDLSKPEVRQAPTQ